MTVTIVKHSYYKIEIDTVDAPQQPIVYFRKEGKCKTAKGMERQHERVVNLCVEALRDLPAGFWRRLTVTRVPIEQVAQGSL